MQAALEFDVAGLGEAASALPVAQLARADDRGRTLLHVAMSALIKSEPYCMKHACTSVYVCVCLWH